MDITYNWSISGVDGTPADGEKKNIVRVIHWRCSGYVTDYPIISNSRGGFVILDEPGEDYSFIDYAELTEEHLMEWLFASLDKKRVESEIGEQLQLVPAMREIKNKSPMWMHWDPNNGPEPTPPPPAIEPHTVQEPVVFA